MDASTKTLKKLMKTELTPEEIELSRKITKWTLIGTISLLLIRILISYL